MIIRNSARCNGCGEEVESTHQHDYATCKCGQTAVDGGHAYLRRAGSNWTDTSVIKESFDSPDDVWSYLGRIHSAERCVGDYCTVHNPSNHRMRQWPCDWIDSQLQRLCPHGVWHVDPDELDHSWDEDLCEACLS